MSRSLLRMGEPRLGAKPARGSNPCSEPVNYGTNILADPGFELHVSQTGHSDLSSRSAGLTRYPAWEDGSEDAVSHWVGEYGLADGPSAWTVSTTEPHSGTYHAESVAYDPGGSGATLPGAIWLRGFTTCLDIPGDIDLATARVKHGDFVRLTFWAKATNLTGTPGVQVWVSWRDAGMADLGNDDSGVVNLTASYAKYKYDLFVHHPTAKYLMVWVDFLTQTTPATGMQFRTDTWALEVT